jgi:hypothetical protein
MMNARPTLGQATFASQPTNAGLEYNPSESADLQDVERMLKESRHEP